MDLYKHNLSLFKKSSRFKSSATQIKSIFSFIRHMLYAALYILWAFCKALVHPSQIMHSLKNTSFVQYCIHEIHKRLLKYFLQSLIWLDKIQTCHATYYLPFTKHKPKLHLASYSKLPLECIGFVLLASWYLSPIWHSQLFIQQRYQVLEC